MPRYSSGRGAVPLAMLARAAWHRPRVGGLLLAGMCALPWASFFVATDGQESPDRKVDAG